MIRQYGAYRFKPCPPFPANKRVGTVPVGSIVYIQDGVSPLSGFTRAIVCREPWIVEAWLPREYSKWNADTRHFRTVRMSGGHLAQVRSLWDRRRVKHVADWILLQCIDAGLEKLCQARQQGKYAANHVSQKQPVFLHADQTLLPDL